MTDQPGESVQKNYILVYTIQNLAWDPLPLFQG